MEDLFHAYFDAKVVEEVVWLTLLWGWCGRLSPHLVHGGNVKIAVDFELPPALGGTWEALEVMKLCLKPICCPNCCW